MWDNDWMAGHHWVHHHWMWGGHIVSFGGFWFLIFLVVLFIVLWTRSPHRTDGYYRSRSSALDLLEQRYARGEIGRDEYLEKRRDLMGGY